MATINKEESSQIFADCQAKLLEIDHKLSKIKGRCKQGKTEHKYSLHTNEDFIILKKEAESLESDIQFVKSLLDETTEIESSFPLRFIKRFFPSKKFSSLNKPVSNEIKAKIIAHSTGLLEEKVNLLQTIANSKKKKRKPKLESRDSLVTDNSNFLKPPKAHKSGASSDSEIIMSPEKIPSLKVLSSLKKQHNLSKTLKKDVIVTPDLQIWNSEISKYFTPNHNILSSCVKKPEKKSEYNLITSTEKFVQTVDLLTTKAISTNKYVQTDFPLVKWVTSFFNDGKAIKTYEVKETNTDNTDDTSIFIEGLNNNVKLIQDKEQQELFSLIPNNILDINEIDSIINSLLCSPLKMLQCKHVNKFSGGNINPSGYVNLIIRQSDFMPLLASGMEQRKETFCKNYFFVDCIYFAYSYQVKHSVCYATFKVNERKSSTSPEEKICSDYSLEQCSSMVYNNKVGKTEYSVQLKNPEINKKTPVSSTLQIDYNNPQTSGRIVLTEFGNLQSPAQSDMISRILTNLMGLPKFYEKK